MAWPASTTVYWLQWRLSGWLTPRILAVGGCDGRGLCKPYSVPCSDVHAVDAMCHDIKNWLPLEPREKTKVSLRGGAWCDPVVIIKDFFFCCCCVTQYFCLSKAHWLTLWAFISGLHLHQHSNHSVINLKCCQTREHLHFWNEIWKTMGINHWLNQFLKE